MGGGASEMSSTDKAHLFSRHACYDSLCLEVLVRIPPSLCVVYTLLGECSLMTERKRVLSQP